jgi:glutamate/tyrosine decarboxylase-like PLP-dependent enzyme
MPDSHVQAAFPPGRPPSINAALFPDAATRGQLEGSLSQSLEDARRAIAGGRITPSLDAGFIEALAGFDFESPRPLTDLLQWTVDVMRVGNVQMTHPGYFGLFNPAPTFPAECAERIVAAFNPQLATSTTSPAAIRIEMHVIEAIARRAGLPAHTTGHFTSGGSEANFTALICSLVKASPHFVEKGVRAFAGTPILYISQDAHLAWYKIAQEAGVGRSSVRLIPSDGSGRMDAEALSAMIAQDKAQGHVPVMIAATAGTTNAGMIDPLSACAEIARASGIWFHVDAAWGGALIASAPRRHLLDGLASADSVTIDAHKWFATTMACGMFLTTVPGILSETFHVSAGFMPPGAALPDPYLTSTQWSRRFIGLRLFLSLATAGWDGYAEHVEHSIGLADRLRQALEADGWHVANESHLAVLCVCPPPHFPSPQAVVKQILASGQAWVSTANFEGKDVIRICVVNGRTTESDIHALVSLLQDTRHPVERETPQQSAPSLAHAFSGRGAAAAE